MGNQPLNTTLITGASSGIGASFAHEFAKNNHDLILVARNIEKLNTLKLEIEDKYPVRVFVLQKDITKEGACQEIIAWTEKENLSVDVLVNNAGIGSYGKFHEMSWDTQSNMIRLNMYSLTELTHLFLTKMTKANKGAILNVASTAAFQPGPLMAVYFASKSYVLSFTEAITNELKDTNIRVSALCPGPTKSNFGTNSGFISNDGFNNASMSSEEVAAFGYKALMKKTVVAIPGFMNSLLANGNRFIPRNIATYLTRKTIERF